MINITNPKRFKEKMKKYSTLVVSSLMLFAVSGTANAQLAVKPNGQVLINGQSGSKQTAATMSIKSSGTEPFGDNTALSLFNQTNSLNNWLNVAFQGNNTSIQNKDYAGLSLQFVNRTTNGESGNFHISTLNSGKYSHRFSILSSGYKPIHRETAFFLNTRNNTSSASGIYEMVLSTISGGLWIANNGTYSPILHPDGNVSGALGLPDYRWAILYTSKINSVYPVSVVSDARAKKKIETIEDNTLEKISALRPVRYELVVVEPDNEDGVTTEHLGFIAQELIEVYPEVVTYDEENDAYGVRYSELIAVLTKGIQELKNEIQDLRGQLNTGRSGDPNSAFIGEKSAQKGFLNDVSGQKASLIGCNPNPVKSTSEITFFVPTDVSSASIYILDLNGKLIKSIPLSQRGHSSVEINSSEYSDGLYLYSLIVNDREVETKKMIVKGRK